MNIHLVWLTRDHSARDQTSFRSAVGSLRVPVSVSEKTSLLANPENARLVSRGSHYNSGVFSIGSAKREALSESTRYSSHAEESTTFTIDLVPFR